LQSIVAKIPVSSLPCRLLTPLTDRCQVKKGREPRNQRKENPTRGFIRRVVLQPKKQDEKGSVAARDGKLLGNDAQAHNPKAAVRSAKTTAQGEQTAKPRGKVDQVAEGASEEDSGTCRAESEYGGRKNGPREEDDEVEAA
jgi:hypothetical protein